MPTNNLRRGKQCATCATPVALRAEIARRARAGQSLRSISEFVINEGHGLGRAAITLHVRQCLGLEERPEDQSPQVASVLLASDVALVAARWPSLGREISRHAAASGLTVEAEIIMNSIPESLRCPLPEPDAECSPEAELLAGRHLVVALRSVLSKAHPAASRDIAAELQERGAGDLADSFLFLADRASGLALAPPVTPEELADAKAEAATP